jgi:hypothetical protein
MSTLLMTRGDTRVFTIPFTLNTYTPVDISAAEAIAFTTTLFSCTLAGGQIVVTNGPGGIATLTIPSSFTNSLPNTRTTVPYQVILTDAFGNVTTTEGGAVGPPCTLTIAPNV